MFVPCVEGLTGKQQMDAINRIYAELGRGRGVRVWAGLLRNLHGDHTKAITDTIVFVVVSWFSNNIFYVCDPPQFYCE